MKLKDQHGVQLVVTSTRDNHEEDPFRKREIAVIFITSLLFWIVVLTLIGLAKHFLLA